MGSRSGEPVQCRNVAGRITERDRTSPMRALASAAFAVSRHPREPVIPREGFRDYGEEYREFCRPRRAN
jgi:hypothetical protein